MSQFIHDNLNKKHDQTLRYLERIQDLKESLMYLNKTPEFHRKKDSFLKVVLPSIFLGIFIALMLVSFVVKTKSFPLNTRIFIPEGAGVSEIAGILKNSNVIVSEKIFLVSAHALQVGGKTIKAGTYIFEEKQTLFTLIIKMLKGEYGDSFISITIPEGTTLEGIANILEREFSEAISESLDSGDSQVKMAFNKKEFLEKATPYNGFLFPDTYYLTLSDDVDSIIDRMHSRFSDVLAEIAPNKVGELSAEELRDIVIMASIIEREANGESDSYLISGVLWKRIEKGMLLQVDATLFYLLGKASSELTYDDLASSSPYNTYTHEGLPPGPIGNPGRIALDAALHPADSPYYYYLHSSDGQAHFGKTFSDHRLNKSKYLK